VGEFLFLGVKLVKIWLGPAFFRLDLDWRWGSRVVILIHSLPLPLFLGGARDRDVGVTATPTRLLGKIVYRTVIRRWRAGLYSFRNQFFPPSRSLKRPRIQVGRLDIAIAALLGFRPLPRTAIYIYMV
jgi:hypothetical protein